MQWVPQADGNESMVADAITMAEGLADAYCGRALASASHTETYTVGSQQETIALQHYPVTAVTTVLEGVVGGSPTTLTTDDWDLDGNPGLLHRVESCWAEGVQNVTVTYTAGYTTTTLPAGLKVALLQLVAWVFEGRGNVGAAQDSADGRSVTYDPLDGPVPSRIGAMLQPYKAVSLG
jgi:uncharacterized phiE125 gp8 family phage protein